MDLPPIYASPGDRNDGVSAAEMAQRHLAVTPLLRGLGGSLTMSNSDDADDFLEEAGRTLQAAIKVCSICSSSVTASQTNICARWKITRCA